MEDHKRLEIYDKVNACESLEDLSKIILELADSEGFIQGRTRRFNAKKMSDKCINFKISFPNVLTRMYGIRQQAMYIFYYNKVNYEL